MRTFLIFVVILTMTMSFAGCSRPAITLYIIDAQDIQEMTKGEPYTPDRDGFFISDFYMKEAMGADVVGE